MELFLALGINMPPPNGCTYFLLSEYKIYLENLENITPQYHSDATYYVGKYFIIEKY